MPTIILDGTGPTKASLIEMAYEHCALAGFEFERSAEEMTAGLRQMNAMLAEWDEDGIDLGYDFPAYADGLLEEPSGLPTSAVAVVTSMLAQRLAPGMGKALSPAAAAALNRSYFALRSRFATVTPVIPSYATRGAGWKRRVPYVGTRTDETDPGDLASIVRG